MSAALRRKIDSRSRHELSQGPETDAIEVLIRTVAPPTCEQQQALTTAGLVPYATVGRVLTGAIRGKDHLEAIADLPFVSEIEVSRRLFRE